MKNLRKGFTLIELLVVIAIIGILSAIVLTVLSDAREKAEWAAFDQELVQIKTAIQLYRENNNGNWPGFSSVQGTLMSDVLTELNNAGLYSLTELEDPHGNEYGVWPGYKTNSSNYISCGSNISDAYFVINNTTNDNTVGENSSLLKQVYLNGILFSTSFCTEIK